MSRLTKPLKAAKQRFENEVFGVLAKYGYPPFGRGQRGGRGRGSQEAKPPYAYEVDPRWLINVANNQSIMNNSVETKVHQTFRRGFTGLEKRWEAKCPECDHTFSTLDPFKLDEEISNEEVDMDTPRLCPHAECPSEGPVEMITPDPSNRDVAESFLERANMRDTNDDLDPGRHASISQTFLEVCETVARDIQVFDDGWMIFERSYVLEEDGSVFQWNLRDVHRAPAHLMRYSVDDDSGKIGNEYWVCLECRAKNPEDYSPEKKPGECQKCGSRTYEVFAYMLDDIMGDPVEYYIRGEFAHASEYQPSFLYGYSPILSVWQEGRTLENMDSWYQEAYEQRRAPRGAIIIRSSNAESVRAWNTEQMEKLNADDGHIPTFIDDTDGQGDPLKFEPLLEEPAAMQHMEMREWFKNRISSKFGVTQVFQDAGAESSGMSQSLEIVVTNRSTERLKSVFDNVFLPAFLGQVKAEGWELRVSPPEPEDEQAEAQLTGRHLNNLQVAQQLGLDAKWTDEDVADIKQGEIADEPQGGGAEGNMAEALAGGEPEDAPGQGGSGGTTPSGGRPDEPNEMGGAPDEPQDPSTDEPYNRQDSGGSGSVTSGSSGYSSTSYGGADEEISEYLQSVREALNEDESKADEAVSEAKEAYNGAGIGPGIERLTALAHDPDKSFQDLRRAEGGDWVEDYTKNHVVRQMYDIVQRAPPEDE